MGQTPSSLSSPKIWSHAFSYLGDLGGPSGPDQAKAPHALHLSRARREVGVLHAVAHPGHRALVVHPLKRVHRHLECALPHRVHSDLKPRVMGGCDGFVELRLLDPQ